MDMHRQSLLMLSPEGTNIFFIGRIRISEGCQAFFTVEMDFFPKKVAEQNSKVVSLTRVLFKRK